jgi:hypothetical protein
MSSSYRRSVPSNDDEHVDLTQDAPPPYSADPNVYQGEQSVQSGPIRPFLPAAERPSIPIPIVAPLPRPSSYNSLSTLSTAAQSNGWNQPAPRFLGQSTANSWSNYPGMSRSTSDLTSPSNPAPIAIPIAPAPPPAAPAGPSPPRQHPVSPPSRQHPTQLSRAHTVATTPNVHGHHSRATPNVHGHHTRASSDFARDFYASGTDADPIDLTAADGHVHSASARFANQQLTEAPPLSPAGKGGGGIPDDGRPTRTPMPGHPLLMNEKILVYPPGYECDKCAFTFL